MSAQRVVCTSSPSFQAWLSLGPTKALGFRTNYFPSLRHQKALITHTWGSKAVCGINSAALPATQGRKERGKMQVFGSWALLGGARVPKHWGLLLPLTGTSGLQRTLRDSG